MTSHLPDGTRLAYGTATADTFTARPGTIRDGSDGSVACAS